MHWLKPLLLNLYYGLQYPQRRCAKGGVRPPDAPIMVLCYHRVADDRATPWTLSNRTFNRQIDWLQQRFDMISLPEVQERLCGGIQPSGSRQHHLRRRLRFELRRRPATARRAQDPLHLFRFDGKCAQARPFSHDLAAGATLAPNTVAQLHAMIADGIEIGAHTRTHADLGRIVDPDELYDEVIAGAEDLEAAIGQPIRYFAFPFGKCPNMNSAAFALGHTRGYAAMCSAYGGYNFPGDDPFHLQRIVVDGLDVRLKNWVTLDPRKLPHDRPVSVRTTRRRRIGPGRNGCVMTISSSKKESGPLSERLHADTLADSVVVLLVMTVLQRLIGFGRGMLFCRWLDSEQLGLWDVMFGCINLAAPLAVLGLPGSFGRYVEYYRQRGQLRVFLRRTAAFSGAMTLAAVAAVICGRQWCAATIFGRGDLGQVMTWLALALAAVIVFNSVVLLLIAVRLHRLVNQLQFLQSLGFALLSLLLFEFWRLSSTAAVVAFAVSAGVCSLAGIYTLRRVWIAAPTSGEPLTHAAMWSKVVPFALWVWVTNVLYNLFDVVDRYMILHHSRLEIHEALRQVGNYHTSRIVPVLLAAVAGLLGAMLTPHLSHDWERGLRTRVSDRLNLVLKVVSMALLAAASATLVCGPLLFEYGFQNKYAAGLAVLPWTLAYCSWFGLFAVAQNYLFCAERAGLSSFALLVGLCLNIGLNLLLLPAWGLHGAVWATAVANLAALLLVLAFSALAGMRVDRGTWILALAPLALGGGTLLAAASLLLLGVAACGSAIFDAREKRELADGLRRCLRRVLRGRVPDELAAPAAALPTQFPEPTI